MDVERRMPLPSILGRSSVKAFDDFAPNLEAVCIGLQQSCAALSF
jgi:hypothetical protein